MNKQQKKDKLMLENLDRIVAGEKLKDDAQLDKETKAALELTREMTTWPKSPTKEFAADLKARVTHQVVEQKKRDAAKNGDIEYRDFLRRPAWQMTIGAAIMVIIAIIIFLVIYFLNR
jgi:hypothetical protein